MYISGSNLIFSDGGCSFFFCTQGSSIFEKPMLMVMFFGIPGVCRLWGSVAFNQFYIHIHCSKICKM
jgi:hypothetical protein